MEAMIILVKLGAVLAVAILAYALWRQIKDALKK